MELQNKVSKKKLSRILLIFVGILFLILVEIQWRWVDIGMKKMNGNMNGQKIILKKMNKHQKKKKRESLHISFF